MDLSKIAHDWRLHLGIAAVIAIVIRSIPAWIYAGWGNDFGIYYSITIKFLAVKNPLYDYPAVWGSSGYGSFPMLYITILIAHYLTGLNPNILLLKVPPIIGGLTVIPLYFIAYELTKNKHLALGSALLLAINPVHVYQTSMPYFLTIGHLFLLTSLYFFIRWQKSSKKALFYLTFSSIALLLSHHLTNYIYIISLIGISFILATFGVSSKRRIYKNYLFIFIYSGLTFVYWIIRVPGMIGFIEAPFKFVIPWYIELSGYYIALCLLFYLSLRIRFHRSFRIERILERIKVKYIFSSSLAMGIAIFILLVVVGLRGYNIPFISVIYSVPFMLTIGFMGVGLARLYKDNNLLYYMGGWLGAVFLSALVSFITWAVLEPWRHVEYMMEPLSIIGAFGIIIILQQDAFKKVSIKKRVIYSFKTPFYVLSHHLSPDLHSGVPAMLRIGDGDMAHEPFEHKSVVNVGKNMQIAFVATVVFIILMTGVSVFPFMGSIELPPQRVSYVVMSGVDWLVMHGDKNYTVATDHKIGTILSAYGFNSSFEYDYKIWNSTEWKSCIWELLGFNGTYSPIGYVLISMDMREYGVYGYNVLQDPTAPPIIMSNESYEKFEHEPFEMIFENHTIDYSDWVEIYWVNWTYISSHINLSAYENTTKSLNTLDEASSGESNTLFTISSWSPTITFYLLNGEKHLRDISHPPSLSTSESIYHIFKTHLFHNDIRYFSNIYPVLASDVEYFHIFPTIFIAEDYCVNAIFHI